MPGSDQWQAPPERARDQRLHEAPSPRVQPQEVHATHRREIVRAVGRLRRPPSEAMWAALEADLEPVIMQAERSGLPLYAVLCRSPTSRVIFEWSRKNGLLPDGSPP